MKQNKRTMVVSSVLGLIMMGSVALFAGNLAGCKYNGFCDSGFHPPFGPGRFHPGFMSDGLPEFAAQRLDDHVEDLNLSESQKQQYQNIRESFKQLVARHAAQRKAFFLQLAEAIQGPNPDAEVVGALVKAHARLIPDAIDSHVDLFLSFYDILDEDQKALLIEQAQKRFKRLERFLNRSKGSTGDMDVTGGDKDHEAQE